MDVVLCRLVLVDDRRGLLGALQLHQDVQQLLLFELRVIDGLILVDCGLRSVLREIMRPAFNPSVKARLVFPLVVLPAHHEGVFYPDQALPHVHSHVLAGLPECQAVAVSVEYVERRSGVHVLLRTLERRRQKFFKLRVAHVVVFDFQLLFGTAFVVHVVRGIRQ